MTPSESAGNSPLLHHRPSLGLGKGAIEAVEDALGPFEGIADELLETLPASAM